MVSADRSTYWRSRWSGMRARASQRRQNSVVAVSRSLRVGGVDRAVQRSREREGTERHVALGERVPAAYGTALGAHRHVGDQPDRLTAAVRIGSASVGIDGPGGRRTPVVERRFAHHLDLDRAGQADRRADEQVLGIVVGGRSRVRRRVVGSRPRAHRQCLPDLEPSARRVPGGHEHVRPRLVGASGRHVDAVRREPEVAGATVEEAAEHARAVEPRHAQPVDGPVGCHQGTGVAVGEERVLRDRRERRPGGGTHQLSLSRM